MTLPGQVHGHCDNSIPEGCGVGQEVTGSASLAELLQ